MIPYADLVAEFRRCGSVVDQRPEPATVIW
jgi:hypothetical protein